MNLSTKRFQITHSILGIWQAAAEAKLKFLLDVMFQFISTSLEDY